MLYRCMSDPRETIQTCACAILAMSFASGGWLLLTCVSSPPVLAVTYPFEPATAVEWCAGAVEGSTKQREREVGEDRKSVV